METFSVGGVAVRIGLLCLMLISAACGGGGGSGNSAAFDGESSVGGIWTGWMKDGLDEKALVTGIVLEDGTYLFLNDQCITLFGEAEVHGSELTGEGIWACDRSNWSRTGSGVVVGLHGTNILAGRFVEKGQMNGEISMRHNKSVVARRQFSFKFDPIYYLDSSLAEIAGTYVKKDALLIVDSRGSISGQDAGGCVYHGTVSVIDPAYNAYDFRFTHSDCPGHGEYLNSLEFVGFAYLEGSAASRGGLTYIAVAPISDGYTTISTTWPRQ